MWFKVDGCNGGIRWLMLAIKRRYVGGGLRGSGWFKVKMMKGSLWWRLLLEW